MQIKINITEEHINKCRAFLILADKGEEFDNMMSNAGEELPLDLDKMPYKDDADRVAFTAGLILATLEQNESRTIHELK